MKYNNYDRKTLIRIIKKRKDLDYQSLFNHCFELLESIVGNEEQKNNYDYDESFADFNDCINGVNMNRKEAIQIIRNALECYVEDCISQDDELQHKVYEAFEILKTDERG